MEENNVEQTQVMDHTQEEQNDQQSQDRNDWHDSRFDTIDDQAMAWGDLNKKIGGFSGAPEGDYEYNLRDGWDIDKDSQTVRDLQEFGRKVNMDQGTMDGLFDIYMDEMAAHEVTEEKEMEALGDNAEQRIQAIDNWIARVGDDKLTDFVSEHSSTAREVEMIEHFMQMQTGESSVTRQDNGQTAGDTLVDVQAAMADPRYHDRTSIGQAYRAQTDARMRRLFNE